MTVSARTPRTLPTITDPKLVVWQAALRPIVRRALPPATPQNFQITNSRGGLKLSWSPVQRISTTHGPDGYELLRSQDGSFTGDVQIIPIKDIRQTSYVDALGTPTTVHYRIRATAGSNTSPQSLRGPESGSVRHVSLDPADTQSQPTTVFDRYTTDRVRSTARFGNYGIEVFQGNPAVNGLPSGGTTTPVASPAGAPTPSAGSSLNKAALPATVVYTDQANTYANLPQVFTAGTNGLRFTDPTDTSKIVQFDASNLTTATTRTVNIPDAASTTAQTKVAVTNQFLTAMSAQGVFTSVQPAFTNLSGAASGVQVFPHYTVASLPATPAEGDLAYATNGRKVGEGAGTGTGVPCYFSNAVWRVFSSDVAVAA